MRTDLRADCGSCFGLCCVALPFAASRDFAHAKAGGEPCRNLREDHGCAIHARLRTEGYPGCTVFDCFGAGQKVSQVTFGGRGWREAPETAAQMFAALPVMRQLHELMWYAAEALDLPAARPVHGELREALAEVEQLTLSAADVLAKADVPALRASVGALLLRASELARAAAVPGRRRDHRGADLMGRRLRAADLRGASLRGALLVAADLRGADLRWADVTGADLRDTRLAGADLRDCLFLTQSQLTAASGDSTTRLPRSLHRPGHWA
ncbi:pentapeptide repeat-containing protein [Streptomyces polyrhachis]|uniref:Pentapeptide repeat-containing protein n=1 Tax=Streptomyces polyrhachis TaxID=1282885 RepID=A0ABW2GM13_9ACTN